MLRAKAIFNVNPFVCATTKHRLNGLNLFTNPAPAAHRFTVWAMAFTLFYLAAIAPVTHAAIIGVDCNSNALQTAITTANNNAQSDTLVLAESCVYSLTAVNNTTNTGGANALPLITTEIFISGNNAIIERFLPDNQQQFPADRMRFFQITDTGFLTLDNLTLQNGHGSNGDNSVSPVDVSFLGRAPGGGAILAAGDVSLNRVSLLNNRTGDGSATLTTSAANGGGGSAISSYANSNVIIDNSLIDGNQTGNGFNNNGPGDGVLKINGASLSIDRSTISNNSIGDPTNYSGGTVASIISAFPDNLFELTRSTISANSVNQGHPGFFFNGNLADIEFSHNTFFNNNSGGSTLINISGAATDSPIIRNNIFEANGSSCYANDGLNTSLSTGNIFSDTDSCGLSNGVNNNITGVAANVMPLALNGGRNPTHNLPSGSPALDRISTPVSGLQYDQRGNGFFFGSGPEYGQNGGTVRYPSTSVDIGAIEAITVQAIVGNFASTGNMLSDGRQQDWYSIKLGEGETINYTVTFEHANGDVDTTLFNKSALDSFLDTSEGVSGIETIEHTATVAGEYWFVVYGFGLAVNDYDLNVSVKRNEQCFPIPAANGNIAVVCL